MGTGVTAGRAAIAGAGGSGATAADGATSAGATAEAVGAGAAGAGAGAAGICCASALLAKSEKVKDRRGVRSFIFKTVPFGAAHGSLNVTNQRHIGELRTTHLPRAT